MRNLFLWVFFLLLLLFLQMVIMPHFLFLPLKIDLILLLVLAYSLLQGSRKGIVFGLVAGLLCDVFGGSPFGFQILLKGLFGGLAGLLNGMYFENQPGVPLVTVLLAVNLNEFLQDLGHRLFFRGSFWPSSSYWSGYWLFILLQLGLFLILYYLSRHLLLWEKRVGFLKD